MTYSRSPKGIGPMRAFLSASRFFILVAVVASTVSAIALTIYGALAVGSDIAEIFRTIDFQSIHKKEVEKYALDFIALIDLFLLSTVLYIVGLGLYELFIDPDMPVHGWLRITSLDDLKDKLAGVVIVLIAVDFLGDFVESEGDIGILWLGLGGGAIILALAVGLNWLPRHAGKGGTSDDSAAPSSDEPPRH